jgi:hypothetical protein
MSSILLVDLIAMASVDVVIVSVRSVIALAASVMIIDAVLVVVRRMGV